MLGNLRQSCILDSSNLFQSLSVEVWFVSAVPDSLSWVFGGILDFRKGQRLISLVTSPYLKNVAQPHARLSLPVLVLFISSFTHETWPANAEIKNRMSLQKLCSPVLKPVFCSDFLPQVVAYGSKSIAERNFNIAAMTSENSWPGWNTIHFGKEWVGSFSPFPLFFVRQVVTLNKGKLINSSNRQCFSHKCSMSSTTPKTHKG